MGATQGMNAGEELARDAAKPPALELVPGGYEDDEDPEVSQRAGWAPHDLISLDWALKRKAALEAEVSMNEEITQARIQELELKCARLNERAMGGIRYFDGAIRAYCETHREELLQGGKKKSRALPHGVVGWRKRGEGLEVVDRAALLKWVQEQPLELGMLRIKEEVELREVKAYAEKANVVPPGMQANPEVDELQVRAGMKEVL